MNKNENKWIDFHQKAGEEAEEERASTRRDKTYFKMRINEAIEDNEFNPRELYNIQGNQIEEVLLNCVTLSNIGTSQIQKETIFEKLLHLFKQCPSAANKFQPKLYED
tara:strand:- start:843 stop:1166 length:324 start_codon:yes stop_codon:yes gene_type:complete